MDNFSFGHHIIQTSPHFTTIGWKDAFNVESAYHLDGNIADQTARAHVPDAMFSGHTVLTAPSPSDGQDARLQVERYYTSVAYDGPVFEFGACIRASGRAVFWGKGKGHAKGDLLEFDMGRCHYSNRSSDGSSESDDCGGDSRRGRGRGRGRVGRRGGNSRPIAKTKAKAKAKATAKAKAKDGSRLAKH